MDPIRCDECGIGQCRPFKTTFMLGLGRRMLIIPDSLAYRCDICDNRFFDEIFLEGVHALLTQASAAQKRPARRSLATPPEAPKSPHLRRSH